MALERYRGDVKLLTAAEQYMLAMATLPHAPLLLEILLFKHQFREHITELDRQVREREGEGRGRGGGGEGGGQAL